MHFIYIYSHKKNELTSSAKYFIIYKDIYRTNNKRYIA